MLQIRVPVYFEDVAVELVLLLVGHAVYYGVNSVVHIRPIAINEEFKDVIHALQLVVDFLKLICALLNILCPFDWQLCHRLHDVHGQFLTNEFPNRVFELASLMDDADWAEDLTI